MSGAASAPAIPRLALADGPDAISRALDESGAAIVEDAMGAGRHAEISAALAPWFAEGFAGEGPFFGRRTVRFSGLLAKAPITAALAIDAVILGAAERALRAGSPWCDRVQLNLTQAIAIGPGEGAQLTHRDDDFFPYPRNPEAGLEAMVNALWTLDPFTAANGATRIAPGSHRWPRKRRPEPHEIAAAEAPAGAAILWLGSTLHGGGANRTSAARRGVVMSYSVGWLAQAEKLLLSTPPEIARALPERAQRLIGYQTHRPNLGWVEGRDPLEWLRGSVGALAPARDNLTPDQEAKIAAAGYA